MITDRFSKDQIKVFFFYSPVQELLTSLHVMANPSHHLETRDWAFDRYQRLSGRLQSEISFFAENYADWNFIIDVMLTIAESSYPKKLTVEEALDAMMQMDDYEFAELFLGLTAFDYDPKLLKGWIQNPDTVTDEALGVQRQFLSSENVSAFLKDIGAMKLRLKKTISAYWEECFKEEWTAIELYFESVIRKEELLLQQEGNYLSYIDALHPDLLIKDDEIIFNKEPSYSVALEKVKKLVIVLSVFTAPHLRGNFAGDTLDIAKNLNFHSVKMQQDVPAEVYNLIYAACDQTRLKIMKILWNSDATTKEISEILALSPSTISLHLKILKDANLVETNKIKKYVYYKLKKEPYFSLQEKLVQYLSY